MTKKRRKKRKILPRLPRGLTRRDRYLRRTYGITEAQYLYMLGLRFGGCHICGRMPNPGRNLHVDQDHKTKRVRGLLDYRCNHRLLGRGLEDAELHSRAAEYLRRSFDGRAIVKGSSEPLFLE